MYRIVVTAEERERGTARVKEETMNVVRRLYEGALEKDPRATITITLSADNIPAPTE